MLKLITTGNNLLRLDIIYFILSIISSYKYMAVTPYIISTMYNTLSKTRLTTLVLHILV